MLTGRYRYRLGFRRKLVLQVEYTFMAVDHSIALQPDVDRMKPRTAWRDATIEDIQEDGEFDAVANPD